MILRVAASLRVQGERRQRQALHRRHDEVRQQESLITVVLNEGRHAVSVQSPQGGGNPADR